MDIRNIDTYWDNDTNRAVFYVKNLKIGFFCEISFYYDKTKYASAYDAAFDYDFTLDCGRIVWVVGVRPDQVRSHWNFFYVLEMLLTGSLPGVVYPLNIIIAFPLYACMAILIFAIIVILLPWK
jgi:hypothetical protein